MSLRQMNWNRRARLTTLLTLTVSITLACVFAVVISVVRTQAVTRKFDELRGALHTIASEWNGPGTLDDDLPGVEVAVFTSQGKLLQSSTKQPPTPFMGTRLTSSDAWISYQKGGELFIGSISLRDTYAALRQLAIILGVLWLPLTMLTAAASWYGGGLVLRPIRELVASAERLSGQSDDQLLTTSDRAEFAALANSLNRLIAGVRRSATLQEQFATDAAHELRTPLAKLRTRVEMNLRRDRSVQEHVEAQRAMLVQIDQLTSIVETLMCSARTPDRSATPIRFDSSVVSAVQNWTISRDYPADGISVQTSPCEVAIERDEVAMVVTNLLDNSLHHSESDRCIEVEVIANDGTAELNVRDYGKGISTGDSVLAFERFYRVDEGRSRVDGGSGIGLAVVKRIIENRGGSVAFAPVEVGALVQIRLPLARKPVSVGNNC